MNEVISRKEFLQRCALMGAAAVAGGSFLAGCGGGGKGESGQQAASQTAGAADPCADTSGLTEADLQVRKSLNYVAVSTVEGKSCANCKFFQADQFGEKCGGCQLMKGPVHPEGNCTSWFAMDKG